MVAAQALSPVPEVAAANELERFRWMHLYADRMLIREGRYVEAARQLERRARRWLWAPISLMALWMVNCGMALMQYQRTGRDGELLLALVWALMGASQVVQGVLLIRRTRALARRVESLLQPGA